MPTIGSQALVRILPRTPYDFAALRDAVIRIPVAQHIDVLGYDRASLQVRIYVGSVPAGASLKVQLADDGFSADDPASAFLQTTTADGEEIGALQITDRTVFPFYQSISSQVPGVFGRLMAVLVSFTGGSRGGPTVELGMDLVLSGGSVGATISQPSTYLGYAHEMVEVVESFEQLTPKDADVAPLRGGTIATRLATAIRDALARRESVERGEADGSYERFGNVNVAIPQPELGDLTDIVREVLIRGGIDLETPDGGYARFGNVNVGIGAGPGLDDLTSAIRDALIRGGIDLETPDGGYGRFGNVNVARNAPVAEEIEEVSDGEEGTESGT